MARGSKGIKAMVGARRALAAEESNRGENIQKMAHEPGINKYTPIHQTTPTRIKHTTRGRKPWIPTPVILAQIEVMAGRSLKEQQIAMLVGISPQKFSEKKRKFSELSEAMERGRAKAALAVGNACHDLLMAGNVQMTIFLAKSVLGLREKNPQFHESQTMEVRTVSAAHFFEL